MWDLKERMKKSLFLAPALVVALSGLPASAANPCAEGDNCRLISITDALALPWKNGTREFEYSATTKVSLEGKYQCKSCLTYMSLLGLGGSCKSQVDPEKQQVRGHIFDNQGTTTAEYKVKLREEYTIRAAGAGEATMEVSKQVINGQVPVGLKYTFKKIQKDKENNCYVIQDAEFASLQPVYNKEASYLDPVWSGTLGRASRYTMDLGSTRSGFKMPVLRLAKNGTKASKQAFRYSLRDRVGSESGEVSLTDAEGTFRNPGNIYDQAMAASQFKQEALDFLNGGTQSSDVEFWIPASTDKLYMVFANDPTKTPVVFTLSQDFDKITLDGDSIYHEDKAITAFVILGRLEDLKRKIRPSAYRRTYGLFEDAVGRIKDLLTKPGPDGKIATEAQQEVVHQMHTLYYTQNVIMKQRLAMDLDVGNRKESVGMILGQLNNMLKDYGFDEVRSSAPLYAIYGSYVADVINEMRIPTLLDTVPPSLKSVNDALAETYKYASELKVREGLTDANIATGLLVDKMLDAYSKNLLPLLQKSASQGMDWHGYDRKLEDYVESIRGIREVDIEIAANPAAAAAPTAPANGAKKGPAVVNDGLSNGPAAGNTGSKPNAMPVPGRLKK
jgi:hypothetical protein